MVVNEFEKQSNHPQRVSRKNTAIGGKWVSGLASFLSPEKLAVVDDVKGDRDSLFPLRQGERQYGKLDNDYN